MSGTIPVTPPNVTVVPGITYSTGGAGGGGGTWATRDGETVTVTAANAYALRVAA